MTPPPLPGPLLDVRDLTVSVPSADSPLELLSSASFTIAAGEILGLVGESGSGKTVLCRALTRLFPPGSGMRITGEACFNGRDLLSMNEAELEAVRRRHIRYVFQEPTLALNPLLPVAKQLRYAQAGPADMAAATDMLGRVGIGDTMRVLRSHPHQVSVGMAQRVCIAMALLPSPALIIADEPTSALDASLRYAILDLFRQMQRETGNALLLVTHDLDVARTYATRLLVMRAGRLSSSPPPHAARSVRTAAGHAGDLEKPQPLLSVENLHCSVRDATAGRFIARSRPVLCGVSLSIPTRTSIALLGESGSGKSTLARCIVGLQEPERGEIWYDGMNLFPKAENRKRAGRALQLMFQSSGSAFDPRMTILDSLAEAIGRSDREEADRLLKAVRVPSDCLHRYPRQLSGGQLQRIGLARILAAHPKLLVLDEPTSALDSDTAAGLLDLLHTLQGSGHFSILYITHDLRTGLNFCTRAAVMHEGMVVEEGTCDAILSRPSHPVTVRLLRDSRLS